MEGLDYAKIHGKTATFGFWFNTTASGIFPVSFRNNAFNRSYVTTFSASVGWQFITVTIPMDTSAGGTWLFNNGTGLSVLVGGVAGTTFQTLTLNSWQAGNYLSTNTATNWAATAGATINIAQFSIVEGSYAMGGGTNFSRCGKDVQQELAMCQRYYEKSYEMGTAVGSVADQGIINLIATVTGNTLVPIFMKVTKRTQPSFTLYPRSGLTPGNWWNYNNSANTSAAIQVGSSSIFAVSVTATSGNNVGGHFTADAGL